MRQHAHQIGGVPLLLAVVVVHGTIVSDGCDDDVMENLDVLVSRVGGIWHIEIPRLDIATQALDETSIPHMAADAAAAVTGKPATAFSVSIWRKAKPAVEEPELLRQWEEAQRLDRASGEREVWDAAAGDMLAREPWGEGLVPGLTAEESAEYVAEADPGWMSPEAIATRRQGPSAESSDDDATTSHMSDDPLYTMERVSQILRPLAREGVVLWWFDTPTDVLEGMTPYDWIEAGRDANLAIDYANKTGFVWGVGEKE